MPNDMLRDLCDPSRTDAAVISICGEAAIRSARAVERSMGDDNAEAVRMHAADCLEYASEAMRLIDEGDDSLGAAIGSTLMARDCSLKADATD